MARPTGGGRTAHRRILLGVALAAAFVIVGLAVSAVISIVQADHDLADARQAIHMTTEAPQRLGTKSGRAHTSALINRVSDQLASADRDLRDSPGLWAMWAIPYLHSQRQALINLVGDLMTTAGTGRDLLTSLDHLVDTSHGTSVNLAALQHLHQALHVAYGRQRAAQPAVGGDLPLLPTLGTAQQAFEHQNAHLISLLSDGQQLTSYAGAFLGGSGPRTYLLAAENNAEMRDQGSILSYALISTGGGTFSVTDPASVGRLALHAPAPVAVPPGTSYVFGPYQPTQVWQSANYPADFPWTGQDLEAMYQAKTGQQLDGVIALDVPGLARLLKVVGPVRVPGIARPINAGNVSGFLLHKEYAGAPVDNQQQRQDLIASVAKAAVDKMKRTHVDLAAFANALAQDVAGRHLLAWDSVPSYERTIAKFGGSGAVDNDDPRRTFHVDVDDGSPNKLDYYVRVAVRQNVVVLPSGDAQVQTTVTAHNGAPVGARPSYQLGPDGTITHVPGQYVGRVFVWAPRDAIEPGAVAESGLTVSAQEVDVMPGQSRSVSFTATIPHAVQDGQLRLVEIPQPRYRPDTLTIHMAGEGWHLVGPPTVHARWTKTLSWTWQASR